MRTSALLGAKDSGFFENYGESAWTRGVEPVRSFCGQGGGGPFFAILCGRLLWTGPNTLYKTTQQDSYAQKEPGISHTQQQYINQHTTKIKLHHSQLYLPWPRIRMEETSAGDKTRVRLWSVSNIAGCRFPRSPTVGAIQANVEADCLSHHVSLR